MKVCAMKFEDVIERDGKLMYTNSGDSMEPLIKQDRDLVKIERISGRLKKFDVALYKRDSGQYVLHRVIKVNKDGYVLCGDNRYEKEYGITDRHIIGVLTAVIRNGKEMPVKSFRYRLYVHLRCDLFPLHALFRRIKLKLRRKNRGNVKYG